MSAARDHPPVTVASRLPYAFVKQHGVLLPAENAATGEVPCALIRESTSARAMLEAARFLKQIIQFRRVSEDEFNDAIGHTYRNEMSTSLSAVSELEALDDATSAVTEDLLAQGEEAPIIRFLNALIAQAIRDGASDLHIETYEQRIALRLRVDGVLRELPAPPRTIAPQLVSRVKVLAQLDIAERRLPQDGRFSVTIAGKAVDIRVSTIPTRHGERVVLRVLDKDAQRIDLTALGLPATSRHALDAALARPHGIVLVTGPTGSGKSTTLYACLQALNDGSRNILTVEDPVEYDLEGIGQTQVNPKAGFTFARGLRAILRQDPDVVMIGEIRDRETAEIAVQASLTGHLVLSTLHTNTALGAVTRLIDMGVEPFLLGSSVSALIAQRLVRALCVHCRTPYEPTAAERARLGQPRAGESVSSTPWYRATGCTHCHGSGYAGRMAVFEVANIDERLRSAIHAQANESVLEELARATGPGLLDDARARVEAGLTSPEEALRVTRGG